MEYNRLITLDDDDDGSLTEHTSHIWAHSMGSQFWVHVNERSTHEEKGETRNYDACIILPLEQMILLRNELTEAIDKHYAEKFGIE
jgi:hypothetical protein